VTEGSQARHDEDACWREAARLRGEHRSWIIIVRHEVAQVEWTCRLEGRQMPGV
jgi:hypothetical protein